MVKLKHNRFSKIQGITKKSVKKKSTNKTVQTCSVSCKEECVEFQEGQLHQQTQDFVI